jgi:hypothetical protein
MTTRTGRARAAALALALLPVACTQKVFLDGPLDGGGNGQGAFDGGGSNDGGGGGNGDRPGCMAGGSASAPTFQQLVSAIFIALDRSSSMNKTLESMSSTSKLNVVQNALKNVVNRFGPLNTVHFGYVEFPNTDGCPGTNVCCVSQGLGPVNGTTQSVLRAVENCSTGNSSTGCFTPDGTPMTQALLEATSVYSNLTFPQGASRYVLLITDGEPNCAVSSSTSNVCEEAVNAVNQLNLADITTYVVGLGTIPQTDPTVNFDRCLDRIGGQGGADKLLPPSYYQAVTEASVLSTLTDIVSAMSCHFRITPGPANPDHMALDVSGSVISKDPNNANGFWSFDSPSTTDLTVHGPACDTLVSSFITNGVQKIHINGCSVSSH